MIYHNTPGCVKQAKTGSYIERIILDELVYCFGPVRGMSTERANFGRGRGGMGSAAGGG